MGECLIIRSGGGTDTSDATATSSVVLSGFTCYVNDEPVTGAMINRGSVSQSLSPGGSYMIPEGYHDGTGSVGVTALASNTSANAAASQILTGYNGWVNGAKVDGSMANRGNVSQALGANGSYTIPAGWHAGGGKLTQSLATQGAVNVTPGAANKTACAANRWTTGTIVILGSSALTAGNIKNGVTIFGVRGTFTGWVDNSCPITSLQYTTSGLSIPMYADGNNWNRTHYINFPSQDYVKNLIQQFPYVQASVTGSYYTIGNTKNQFSAAISTLARASGGGLKPGWNLVTFSVGAGANSTYSQTGNKLQTKTSFTNGDDDSPTSYVTEIQINARCSEARSNSGWLNSYTINFLKS